ncbi:MAG: hypothetical protein COB54_05900 [Alphaproteobacteria bacterium]|nr:MAG: hypothetical protein COB54_05900 [Alphaproteobacteria bacterium]
MKQIQRYVTYYFKRHFRKIRIRWGLIVSTLGILAGIVSFTVFVERTGQAALTDHARMDSLQSMMVIRSDIERELNKTLFQLGGLAAYISVNPDITEESFNTFTHNILRKKSHIISIGAAPNMVVKYVYPLAENKAALGLDYRTSKSQRELAFLAKSTGKQVIAGPLMSVQGRNVLIAREPVYLAEDRDGKPAGSFWGIVSVLIDAQELFGIINVNDKDYGISIRGRDAKGQVGDVFYGNPDAFLDENIMLSIAVPGGSWQIVAMPNFIANAQTRGTLLLRLVTLFLCLSVLTFSTFRFRYLKEREAEKRKLEVALLGAEKANRAKSEFLAKMSHELRTPLNAIIGFSDLIQNMAQNKSGDDKIGEYAGDINQSGYHLLDIINEILDLSKVESGNFTTTIETVYIQDIAEQSLRHTRTATTKAELETINRISDDLPPIQSDERMIRQIFYNLLSNAIKFTPGGGAITLSAELQMGGEMKITLADSGIGMSEDELVIALQPFGQAGHHLVRKQEGTGLGLPLVKAFVELLGGEFSIQSTVGVGTEITLLFPMTLTTEQMA